MLPPEAPAVAPSAVPDGSSAQAAVPNASVAAAASAMTRTRRVPALIVGVPFVDRRRAVSVGSRRRWHWGCGNGSPPAQPLAQHADDIRSDDRGDEQGSGD